MLVTLFLNSVLASAGFFTMGILFSWPATALPSIRESQEYPVSLEEQSWIGSSASVGALIGTLLSRVLAKQIGSRRGLIICGFASVAGWVLIFLSSIFSLYAIYPGLFLLGWSCGLSNPLSSIYVSEIAGSGNKGMVTSIFNFNITFGVLFTNILGSLTGWFFSSLTMMLLHTVILCAMFLLIPSPYELARANKEEKVIEALAKLRNAAAEDVVPEAKFISKDVEDEMTTHKSNILNTMKNLNKTSLKNLGIVLIVVSMTHLSGCTVITTYVVDIFSSSSISEVVLVLVTGFSEMGFSFLQMVIADKLGRKTFLILSTIGCSLSTLTFAAIFWKIKNSEYTFLIFGSPILDTILSSNMFLVFCLIVYFLSFNIGLGPIKHTLISELFSPGEQETLAGICHTWYWVLSFIAVKMFHMLFINFGLVIIFIIISIICLGSAVFTFLCVPETRIKPENRDFTL